MQNLIKLNYCLTEQLVCVITCPNYDIEFISDCQNSSFKKKSIQIYSNDSTKYELCRYLILQGYGVIYEEKRKLYFYRGQMIKNPYKEIVQIGLFNKSKKLKGIQIGLWNNNGKFSLPIINARF